MVAAVTFDTFETVKRLESKGFTTEQAAGISDALKDVLGDTALATKADLQIEIEKLRGELVRWIVGTGISAVIILYGLLKMHT